MLDILYVVSQMKQLVLWYSDYLMSPVRVGLYGCSRTHNKSKGKQKKDDGKGALGWKFTRDGAKALYWLNIRKREMAY